MPLQKKAYRASTGYFARATENGHRAKSTKVHLVQGGQGLCGYVPHPTMRFQFCAAFPVLAYVECPKCKQIYMDKVAGISKEQRAVLDEIKTLEDTLETLRKAKAPKAQQDAIKGLIKTKEASL